MTLRPWDHHGHIEQVDLQTEMQRSYLDYAMAAHRSCPRRMSVTASSPCTVASSTQCTTAAPPGPRLHQRARVVGDVMGQFHPTEIAPSTTPRASDSELDHALPAGLGQ